MTCSCPYIELERIIYLTAHSRILLWKMDGMASEAASHLSAFEPLNAVRHFKVSKRNPPTSSEEHGLDFERCSELHNAIVRHAWLASGSDLADLPTTTWWQRPENEPYRLKVESSLDMSTSIVEFLKRALVPGPCPGEPDCEDFFYGILGLASAAEIEEDCGDYPEQWLALYETDIEITEEIKGLM